MKYNSTPVSPLQQSGILDLFGFRMHERVTTNFTLLNPSWPFLFLLGARHPT